MLKHRNIPAFFILVFATLLLLENRQPVHWSIYLFLVFIFLGIEFYGAYFIHSGFHLKAVCRIKTQDKVIALSFDDGPALQTEKILEVLDKFNAKATFFCIGNRIGGKEHLLKKINAEGHLVGNHSYSHGFLFDFKTASAFVNDLELCNREIEQVIGKTPAFFRPPYGVTTPGLARAVKKMNLEVVGWNIRSLDTSIKNKQQVLARIKKRLQPGSILLMHDTVAGIEIVLTELLVYLGQQHYKVVPLDELIQKQAYA